MPSQRIWNALAYVTEQVAFAEEEIEHALHQVKLALAVLTTAIKEDEDELLPSVHSADHVEPDRGRDEGAAGRPRGDGRRTGEVQDHTGSSEPGDNPNPGGLSDASTGGPSSHLPATASDLNGCTVELENPPEYAGVRGIVVKTVPSEFGIPYVQVRLVGGVIVQVRKTQVRKVLG